LNEENKQLVTKIESLTNENTNITEKVNSLSRELYMANEKLKELNEEKLKNLDQNLKFENKNNNGNAFDLGNQDFKITNSGGTNMIKFPNNKITGYANINNIDESELNESDFQNSNKRMKEITKVNFGMTDHNRENQLYKESGGFRINNEDNKHDDLFQMTNRISSVDKDKGILKKMNTSGNNFSKNNSNINSNINSNLNYNTNSKNNFDESQTDTLLNFENRSNSHVIFINMKIMFNSF